MNKVSASILDWARQLLAVEAAAPPQNSVPGDPNLVAIRVCEKLQTSLTPFIGAEGFTVLLRRALVLAREDTPLLQNSKVAADGRLELLDRSAASAENYSKAALSITAHFLGLLVTFIGEPLTLRLIGKALPNTTDRTTIESEDFL